MERAAFALDQVMVLGANHVLDQRFSYLRENNPSSVNGDGPETIVRQNGVTMIAFGRANFLPRFVEQSKYALIQTLNWNVGRHAWKFGTFYGRLPGLVARTIQAQNGIQVKSFTLTGAEMPAYPAILSDFPSTGSAAPDIYVMQPGFETPRSHQWSLWGAAGREPYSAAGSFRASSASNQDTGSALGAMST